MRKAETVEMLEPSEQALREKAKELRRSSQCVVRATGNGSTTAAQGVSRRASGRRVDRVEVALVDRRDILPRRLTGHARMLRRVTSCYTVLWYAADAESRLLQLTRDLSKMKLALLEQVVEKPAYGPKASRSASGRTRCTNHRIPSHPSGIQVLRGGGCHRVQRSEASDCGD